MRVTVKGQVTIPLPIRQAAGLPPGTDVDFALGNDGIVRVFRAGTGAGVAAVAGLRGRADAGLTTDQIMALTRD